MHTTTQQITELMSQFVAEDSKFESGNSAAGTRARKALGDLSKLIKQRRNEITAAKNARKAAKAVE